MSGFLAVGDKVSFFSDRAGANGYVTAEGFADDACRFTPTDSNSLPEFEDAVFEVHTLKNHSAKSEYAELVQRLGIGSEMGSASRSNLGGVSGEQLRTLRAQIENESRHNESLQFRALGKEIKYGSVIELMHVKSGKFLRVESEIVAQGNKDALLVRVGDEDEASLFKVLPRFKLHSEGERVHEGDQVILRNVKTGHDLHIQGDQMQHGLAEVNGVVEGGPGVGFAILHYRPFMGAKEEEASLFCGETVRFYNKESDGYLVVDNVAQANAPVLIAPHLLASRSGRASANTLFAVECVPNSNGRVLEWETQVKLRHISTGKYLQVTPASGKEQVELVVRRQSLVMGAIPDDNAGDGEAKFVVSLTSNVKDETTTFDLSPFYKFLGEGPIRVNSTFRLWSKIAQAFLSVLPDTFSDGGEVSKGGIAGAATGKSVSLRKKLGLQEKPLDEDTFVFVRVPHHALVTVHSVKGAVTVLRNFITDFESGNVPQFAKTTFVLRMLIFYVQGITDQSRDPLAVEEPAVAERQVAMKELGVLDMLFDVLAAPFKGNNPASASLDPKAANYVCLAAHKPVFNACCLAYRLIKQAIKDNFACRQHVSNNERVDFVMSQLGHKLKAADTLMELFRNNRALLDMIEPRQIQVFVDLIKSGLGKQTRYMGFLRALVTCDGVGVSTNQKRLVELLLVKEHKGCAIHAKLDNGVVMVDLESIKKPNEQQGSKFVSLEQFARECPKEQLQYFVLQTNMFADLCLGRNNDAIDAVNAHLPYDLCFQAVVNEHLSSDVGYLLRAAFMNLIQAAYVDVDPFDDLARVNLVRPHKGFAVDIPKTPGALSDEFEPPKRTAPRVSVAPRNFSISQSVARKGRSVELVDMTPKDAPGASTPEIGAPETPRQRAARGMDFRPLKRLIRAMVKQGETQTATKIGLNEFILACLRCSLGLMRFGMYASKNEIEDLVPLLMECLDGRDDVIEEGDDPLDPQVIAKRYETNAQNLVIMNCKTTILQLFSVIMELRNDYRLSLLLAMFAKKHESGSYQSHKSRTKASSVAQSSAKGLDVIGGQVLKVGGVVMDRVGDVARIGNKILAQFQESPEFIRVFEEMQLSSDGSHVDVLLDCMCYHYVPVVSEAVGLLIANYSQRLAMFKALQGTQLLVSKESAAAHKTATTHIKAITARIHTTMPPEDEKVVLDALTALENLVKVTPEDPVPKTTNQNILRSVYCDDIVHRLLRLPFTNKLPEEQGRREIFLVCYRLLKFFATSNPLNQKRLLPHVPLYLSQMGVKLKAADTLSEVFRRNTQVCSQVEESSVVHVVNIIVEGSVFPRYLKFFQILVKPESSTISRNQELVLKALLAKASSTLFLYSTPEGQEERAKLIAANEQQESEGKLHYHAQLLELLAAIVEDSNEATVPKCRMRLTVEQCARDIGDDKLPLFIRNPLIKYFTECYLKGERPSKSLTPQLVAVMCSLHGALRAAADTAGTNKADAQRCVLEVGQAVTSYFEHVEAIVPGAWAPGAVVELAKALADALKRVSLKDTVQATASANAAMAALLGSGASSEIRPDMFPALPGAEDPPNPLLVLGEGEDARMKSSLLEFTTEYQDAVGLRDASGSKTVEFAQLVEIFLDDDPQATAAMAPTLHSPMEGQSLGRGNTNVLHLVNHIVHLKGHAHVKRTALKLLKELALFEDDNQGITKEMSQCRLDKIGEYSHHRFRDKSMGVTRMVLRMVDPKHGDVLKEVFEVGVALCEDGNPHVQTRIAEFFKSEWGVVFFERIQQLIRTGRGELPELLAHYERVREIKKSLRGLSDLEVAEALPIFQEQAPMLELLQFIQVTCENHRGDIQALWHAQDSRRTYDIVSEIAEYLIELEDIGIVDSTQPLVVQAMATLTELMQGPCKINQLTLAGTKVAACAASILQAHGFKRCSVKQEQDIKEQTAICLSAMLEGCRDPSVPQTLHNEIGVGFLFDIVENAHRAVLRDGEDNEDVEEVLQTAFEVFTMLMTLRDYVPEVAEELEEQPKPFQEARQWFDKRTGEIEIAQDDELRRIYFRLPEISNWLTDKDKHNVLWGVERESHTHKLLSFVGMADDLEAQMQHQQGVSNNKYMAFLTQESLWKQVNWASLIVTMLMNWMMLLGYVQPEDSRPSHLGDKRVFLAIWVFGLFALVLCCVRFVSFALSRAPLIASRGIDFVEDFVGQPLVGPLRVVPGAVALLLDATFVINSSLVVLSVFGIAVSPLFFSAHLLMFMVEASQDLQNVLRSVTEHGQSLLMTAAFGVYLIYLHGVWAFVSFRDHYHTEDGDSNCQDLFQCTITTLHGGLRKGDVGEVTQDTEWGDAEFIVFQLVFFAVITTIMLNIIFGIIIDTFSELREEKQTVTDEINNQCFICGLNRFAFERHPGGLEHHTKKEHNTWAYLFFLVHLKGKDECDYTGPESFVSAQLADDSVEWIPQGKAISLLDQLRKEEEAQNRLTTLVEHTVQVVEGVSEVLGKVHAWTQRHDDE